VAPPAKPAEKAAAPEKKTEPAEQSLAQDKKTAPAEQPPSQAKKTESPEKPVPAAAADAAGQWVVQLGAYREAGKVKNLMSKLKGINVPAYTEKVESAQGTLTRVRAGPFPSQEAAEKARARVKIIGVDGPVAPK
jgi:DedD protein